jgi:RimJ/RimL family protein N-acetyltransferase
LTEVTPVELETERLLLRMWRESDVDAYAGMCADPLVMRLNLESQEIKRSRVSPDLLISC